MNWQGHIRWSSKIGASVRVGDHLVPRRVTLTALGDGAHPDLRFEFAMDDDGAARCTEVAVKAKDGGRGVSTADLSLIAVDQLTAAAFEQFASEIVARPDTVIEAVYRGGVTDSSSIRRAVDKGHGPSSPLELLHVARAYASNASAPVQAVVDIVGLSPRTAARRIDSARKLGYLPPKGSPVEAHHVERIDQGLAKLSAPNADAIPISEFNDWWESKGRQNG